MSGRSEEREATALRRIHGSPGGERGGLVGRLRRDRVERDKGRLIDRCDVFYVHARVTKLEIRAFGRLRFDPVRELRQEHGEPRPVLGVVAGRVEPRERGMRQDVDFRTASASDETSRAPCARPTR